MQVVGSTAAKILSSSWENAPLSPHLCFFLSELYKPSLLLNRMGFLYMSFLLVDTMEAGGGEGLITSVGSPPPAEQDNLYQKKCQTPRQNPQSSFA